MKVLVAGFAVAAALGAVSGAHAQADRGNLPFLKPQQNGAQVQVPRGWPPGSGDIAAPPPTSFVRPGGSAPFQGGNLSRDRRGAVGERVQPRANTPDPPIGMPKGNAGAARQGASQQDNRNQTIINQNIIAKQRAQQQGAALSPGTARLPKDPPVSRALDLFRSSREVKPPTQVNVHVAVGSRLPTSWVYRDVPEIVTIAFPRYLGYVYTYVNGSYVVTDPKTYRVVAIYVDAPAGTMFRRK